MGSLLSHAHTHTHFYLYRVEHSGFFAEPCAASGVVLIAVGYDLAPKG